MLPRRGALALLRNTSLARSALSQGAGSRDPANPIIREAAAVGEQRRHVSKRGRRGRVVPNTPE